MRYIVSLLTICLCLIWAQTLSAASAKANIKGTAETSSISGVASFEDTTQGLHISVEIHGAPEGIHGFHIHEFGDTSNSGKAAGGHYNPDQHDHGDVVKDGLEAAHAGDLGNIEIDADGNGKLHLTVPNLFVTGNANSVAGRAVILHEKPDDFGQPTGNAGSRIGAGTIVITGN